MKLTDPIFTDEAKARAYFEAIRWPNGPVCPHCATTNKVYLLKGKTTRPGLYYCNVCQGSFTVKTGGVMESSKIPLNKWALGFYLYAASKKGFSAHQLGRQLGITYKSAWFMSHRIRTPAIGQELRLGGPGKVVEADETELSPSRKTRSKAVVDGFRDRSRYKRFVSLIERDGAVRSHVITGREMSPIRKAVRETIKPGTVLHTDGGSAYKNLMPVGWHESVDHNKHYAKDGIGERVHVNTAEDYFSIFKRGLVGTYQHMDERHLPRYLAEFDFRMNNRVSLGANDEARTERAIKGAEGKRLTYLQPHDRRQVQSRT